MSPQAAGERRVRVAAVASHPVQYLAPFYRALATLVDLTVMYAHRVTPAEQARAGFGVEFEWDVPLFDGYHTVWLDNVSARPGVDRFFGCHTPDVAGRIASGGYDGLLVNGWNLLTYWQAVRSARRAGVPVMVRGDSHLGTPRSAARRALKRVAYPRLLSMFDACLAVGIRNEEYYRRYGVADARIFRSPHCVDNAAFAAGARRAREAPGGPRAAFGLPDRGLVVAFAGKLIPEKRPLDVLAAIDDVRRSGVDVHGLIVGDGPMRGVLEEHRHQHGTPVMISGFRNQGSMGGAFAAADVLVLPSASETWGLVVNEAMACGVPVLVSRAAGCMPDLVVEGVTGYSFGCGDVARLASLIRQLAADDALRDCVSRHAVDHVAGFSPERAAAGVVDALRQIAPRTAAAA